MTLIYATLQFCSHVTFQILSLDLNVQHKLNVYISIKKERSLQKVVGKVSPSILNMSHAFQ